MTEKLTLAQRVVRAVCELGDTPDPDQPDTLLVKAGDLEAIIDNHLEDWLIKIYDPPQQSMPEKGEEAAPVAVADSRDALIERLLKALEAAETYVIDGVATAKQNLEMNAAYPARKPRYEAELQEARDIYAECQAARRAALAAVKERIDG